MTPARAAVLLPVLALLAASGARAQSARWTGESCAGLGAWCAGHADSILIRDAGKWAWFWRSVGQAPPPVDFTSHFAVVVLPGLQERGSWQVSWTSVGGENGGYVAHYEIPEARAPLRRPVTPWAAAVFDAPNVQSLGPLQVQCKRDAAPRGRRR